MEYIYYTVADFAADSFFVEWVKHPNEENDSFWVAWLTENPDKLETVQDARQIVLAVSKDEETVPEWEIETVWANIHEARKVSAADVKADTKAVKLWRSKSFIAVVAAIILLLLSGLLLFYTIRSEQVEYTTNYGEKHTIELPDGSMVILNANSRLSLPANWTENSPREVILKGEAFFAVTHEDNNQKFVVHNSQGDQVEVMGTAFNMSDRGSKRQVVLVSGKVFFSPGNNRDPQIELEPGEMIEVTDATGKITKLKVRTEKYTAWKDNKLIFDNTSLRDIAVLLEQDYGYDVILQDKQLAGYRITATLEEKGLQNILSKLSENMPVKIKKQDKRIIISLPD